MTQCGEVLGPGLSRRSLPAPPSWRQRQEVRVREQRVDFPGEVPRGPGVQPRAGGAWGLGPRLQRGPSASHSVYLSPLAKGLQAFPRQRSACAHTCDGGRWERGHGWTDMRAGVGGALSQGALRELGPSPTAVALRAAGSFPAVGPWAEASAPGPAPALS